MNDKNNSFFFVIYKIFKMKIKNVFKFLFVWNLLKNSSIFLIMLELIDVGHSETGYFLVQFLPGGEKLLCFVQNFGVSAALPFIKSMNAVAASQSQ